MEDKNMNTITTSSYQPRSKGKLVGQKAPLRLKDILAIRVRLQIAEETRDLALFSLAIDSKATSLRSDKASRTRRCSWGARVIASNGDAAENPAARAV
jgi:hypothetical protein